MRTASSVTALPAVALCVSLLVVGRCAVAGPADSVLSPIVEEGEREVELLLGTARGRDGRRESASAWSVGYGVTSFWFTELAAAWHKEPGQRHAFDAWEWENRFQLTETGRWPVDVGLVIEIERPKDRTEGYEVRWGPLLQADLTSSVQANLNLLFEKHYRAASPSAAELGYQWQLKYRWKPAFEFGLQGFGDVGPWRHWEPHAEQPHRLGPAVFGRFKAGDHQVVKVNAALLRGLTDAAPRTTLRMQAELEF